MDNHLPIEYLRLALMSTVPFDIYSLGSEAVMRLFQETKSHIGSVKIELVTNGNYSRSQQGPPAATTSIFTHRPTILLVESLDRERQIEAIAHELGHLLLVYRFGLGVVGFRMPHPDNSEEVFRYHSRTRESWFDLLGQIPHTIHHSILVGYLEERYGIRSVHHLRLFQHHFQNDREEIGKDKHLSHARALVAFEYEAMIGQVGKTIDFTKQPDSFQVAYRSAQKHFGNYGPASIPSPSGYRQDVLSFLEDLGHPKEDFLFFPENHDAGKTDAQCKPMSSMYADSEMN